MKLVNTIILDAEGNILPLDDIYCFRIYYSEVPNIGEGIYFDINGNCNVDDEEDIRSFLDFLEEQFPDNNGGTYSFIVKDKKLFRYLNTLWVNIYIQYISKPVENEITKEEYLKALDIVEAYKKVHPEENQVIQSPVLEIRLLDFLQNCTYIPKRVENILSEYFQTFGNSSLDSVRKQDFLKLRNAGMKSWNEFVEIRNEYSKKQVIKN